MPKKDAASAVLGMLSAAGAQTRPPVPEQPTARAPEPFAPEPDVGSTGTTPPAEAAMSASVSTLPTNGKRPGAADDAAPRTLRLRPETAAGLRAAWLEAKRDDVLLTAQDFASELVDEALARRRRSRAINRG
jgi:hypothetical protein